MVGWEGADGGRTEGQQMSFVEHLIENALVAISEAKDDKHQAFVNAMSALYNQQMLKEVHITEDELWEIAQYVVFVWEQDAPKWQEEHKCR
jgi:hypothetical protein